MVYLHILGTGDSPSAKANNKGHLFEHLMRALCESLKMNITHTNKSEDGLEIDLEGPTIIGNVLFFAECKAKETSLNSTDLQKFGFKFYDKREEVKSVRGLLFSLSDLNAKAQELWDSKLKSRYGDEVDCFLHDRIVELLIEHYSLISPDTICSRAVKKIRQKLWRHTTSVY